MADTFNKRFSSGEVSTIPYEANKQWTITGSEFNIYNIHSGLGINPTQSSITEYTTENLLYKSVLVNFYPEFYPTKSLETSSYYQTNNFNLSLTSEDYAISGAFRPGNLKTTYKDFPTGPTQSIFILNIPTSLYSNRILPTTVELELDNNYKVYDDGEYNLLWSGSFLSSSRGTILSQSSHVGNVFYEQGLIVFTSIPLIETSASIIPMSNIFVVTNETCATANNGSVVVTTTNGSGNFSYELLPGYPIQSSNTFTNLNSGNYTLKVYDNVLGNIDTYPIIVGNNNLTTNYQFSLNTVSSTVVQNNPYYKWVEEVYDLVITPALPVGATATLTFEAYQDFSTNFRTPATYRSYTRTPTFPITNTIVLGVTKNGVSQAVNNTSTTGTTPAMVCDPTNSFQNLQNQFQSVVTITAGDTVQLTNRNIISTPNPSPDPLCESIAFNKIQNTLSNVVLVAPCSTRTIDNNTRYNDLYIN